MAGKILVTLDGSGPARNAAKLAVQIAAKRGLSVMGLNIVDEALVMNATENYQAELGQDNGMPASRQELIEWFETKGAEIFTQLEEICQLANVPVETEIIFGGVPDLIMERAEQAEMLSIGRRGNIQAGDSNGLGNNFLKIGHRVQIPILVGGDTFRPVHRIVLVADESSRNQHAINWAGRLKRDLSAELIIVMPPNLNLDQLLAQSDIPLQPGEYQPLVLDSDLPEDFISAIKKNEADLVVTGGFRYPEILEWLVDGQIDQILQNDQIPALLA